MTIGERIRQRRLELNMTQDELAHKAGYKSRSSINKIELSRDLPLRKIQAVAKALDTTPSELVGWEEPQEVINRISNNLKSISGPAVNVFQESYKKDLVFMDWIEKLWSLSPEDKSTVYKVIAALYYSEKKDSASSEEG